MSMRAVVLYCFSVGDGLFMRGARNHLVASTTFTCVLLTHSGHRFGVEARGASSMVEGRGGCWTFAVAFFDCSKGNIQLRH